MISPLGFAVNALATRRLTSLVTEDKITETPRNLIIDQNPEGMAAYLVGCRKCVSIWAGIAVGLLSLPDNRITNTAVHALALSELSLIMDKYIPKEFDL